MSRPGRRGRPLSGGTRLELEGPWRAPRLRPPPPAKDAGIHVLQGARSRRPRQTFSSLRTLQFRRGPTVRLTAPLGPRLRRCQRLGAVASQPTAARCGRESNPRQPGYQPGALPLSYHTWSRPGSESLHGTRPADRPETGPARRGPDETSACLKFARCVPQVAPRMSPLKVKTTRISSLAPLPGSGEQADAGMIETYQFAVAARGPPDSQTGP